MRASTTVLVCVVINNSSYSTVKNNTAYHAFGNSTVKNNTAYHELRHSSELVLLTKWPVFLQNAFGNPAYVNQTNLNGKREIKKKTGGASKNLGWPWPTQAPP